MGRKRGARDGRGRTNGELLGMGLGLGVSSTGGGPQEWLEF